MTKNFRVVPQLALRNLTSRSGSPRKASMALKLMALALALLITTSHAAVLLSVSGSLNLEVDARKMSSMNGNSTAVTGYVAMADELVALRLDLRSLALPALGRLQVDSMSTRITLPQLVDGESSSSALWTVRAYAYDHLGVGGPLNTAPWTATGGLDAVPRIGPMVSWPATTNMNPFVVDIDKLVQAAVDAPQFGGWLVVRLELLAPDTNRSHQLATAPVTFEVGYYHVCPEYPALPRGSIARSPVTGTTSAPAGDALAVRCEDGTVLVGPATVTCIDGAWNVMPPAVQCVPAPVCADGEVAMQGAAECSPCDAGTYSASNGAARCTACPNFSTSPARSASITNCSCLRGYWAARTEDLLELRCMACPLGAECTGGDAAPVAAPGFAPSGDAPLSFVACPLAGACSEGNGCRRGYTGPLCGACASGYYLIGGVCRSCSAASGLVATSMVLAVFGYAVGSVWLNSRDAHAMTAAAGIAINTAQVVGLIGTLQLEWHPVARAVLDAVSLANVNLDLAAPGCGLGAHDAWMFKFGMTMALPLLFVLPYLVATAVVTRVQRRGAAKTARGGVTSRVMRGAARGYAQTLILCICRSSTARCSMSTAPMSAAGGGDDDQPAAAMLHRRVVSDAAAGDGGGRGVQRRRSRGASDGPGCAPPPAAGLSHRQVQGGYPLV
ncbi:uncharacterized protein AMSG_11037 [Thecamonas trahens ATCC 50062]|uniref:Sushi domain-containing protein n=1 Tax=Thecamonas trahens ATCC 50062 TaxID=461836 RepID=A0A0L0DSY2_THETB|nr:hypothetical protein AMSG_11037 [Thecamonas trahens ATCC 50062]KNC55380.1 hypothetical protein AMSG_11037 [Thecamonas trahens ATCC 50062]|eukprot:XP_013753013.1 hypothetical protein AMSG_11037 [Thecamonas trahens ATCC 50062]